MLAQVGPSWSQVGLIVAQVDFNWIQVVSILFPIGSTWFKGKIWRQFGPAET